MATTRKLKLATKFAIAQAIADSYTNVTVPAKGTKAYGYYFATILNDAQFSIKGKTYTPKTFCKSEDDALHITNLVLNKLSSPGLVQRTVGRVDD